jgi:heme-degrading monooxygenase HmoA
MAVGIRIRFEGGTQEQYEAVFRAIGADENPMSGLIFHSAGPIEAGWGVIDFWESRDAFDQFAGGRLQQAVQAVGEGGFPAPPDIREFPVHNILKP